MSIKQMLSDSFSRLRSGIGGSGADGAERGGERFDEAELEPALRAMRENGRRWLDIYRGDAPWLKEGETSLKLAAAIASELARLTTLELTISPGDGKRSALMSEILGALLPRIRVYTEYACALGGVMLKPCLWHGKINISCLLPTDFDILSFDGSGGISSAVFYDRRTIKGKRYIRCERHIIGEHGYEILNSAYIAEPGHPDKPVALAEVPAWREISERVKIDRLNRPLFAYFSMPCGNAELPGSHIGASVFASAERLLGEADRQFGRLLWEYEGGELAVDASSDMFLLDRSGEPILPKGKERLFRANAIDSAAAPGELFNIFSPELRDVSLINGLNRIIMLIEDAVGLSRGTFSDPAQVAKTATEIRFMRQRTYSTVRDIKNSLSCALDELRHAVDAMLTLYGLAPVGDSEVRVHFDDSIIVDAESVRERDMKEVSLGLMSVEEFRMKWQDGASLSVPNILSEKEDDKE